MKIKYKYKKYKYKKHKYNKYKKTAEGHNVKKYTTSYSPTHPLWDKQALPKKLSNNQPTNQSAHG